MRKRTRLTQNMGNHHDLNSDDFLSQLPDANLVSIFSGLTLKEAVATSGLSRRWRYMWCQALRLDFEDDKRFDTTTAVQPRLRLLMKNEYINWVNQVIRQHRGVTIEEFKISFELDKDSKGAISKWIEFALSKNVQKLELDLMDRNHMLREITKHFVSPRKLLGEIPWSSLKLETKLNFVFPPRILDRISRSSSNQETNSSIPRTPSTKAMEIKFLKSLILKSVNINDEAMTEILVTCKALEHLNIQLCGQLMNIKSSGLDALSYVEISCCPALESIQIFGSPNLATFYYLGQKVDLNVYQEPKRTRFSVVFVKCVRF